MRVLAGTFVVMLGLLNVGCTREGVMLQDAQQGEWSNFRDASHKVSKDARQAETPGAEGTKTKG